jgi:hypothetical protein
MANEQEHRIIEQAEEKIKNRYRDNSLVFFAGKEADHYWLGSNRTVVEDEKRDSFVSINKITGNGIYTPELALVRGISREIYFQGYYQGHPSGITSIAQVIEDFPNVNGNIEPLPTELASGLVRMIIAPHDTLLKYALEREDLLKCYEKLKNSPLPRWQECLNWI